MRYRQYAGRNARRANGKAYGLVADAIYQKRNFGLTFTMAKMDENVVQLPNGLLYLGHPDDRDRFAALPPQGDEFALEDLKSVGPKRHRIGGGEFILKPLTIGFRFKGNQDELFQHADAFFERTAEEHPEYMEERKQNSGMKVYVVTRVGLLALAQEFKTFGIEPTTLTTSQLEETREVIHISEETKLQAAKPHELIISYSKLVEVFDGKPTEVARLVGDFVKQTKDEHPEWFAKRAVNDTETTVLTTEEAKVELIMHMVMNDINLKE